MSLVEIAVALAILGLLIVMVGPSAGVWIQNSKLRNAADSVLAGVQSARLEALKRNKPVMFMLTDPASTAWQVCVYDPVADACSAAADAIISSKSAVEASDNALLAADTVVNPDPLVALAGGTGLPASITFDTFGRVSTAAANNFTRVDVRNPSSEFERRLVILVTIGGQTRMCDPKLTKATNPQGCV